MTAPDRERFTVPNGAIFALEPSSGWIADIAREQFGQWGPLTGCPSAREYEAFLMRRAVSSCHGHWWPRAGARS